MKNHHRLAAALAAVGLMAATFLLGGGTAHAQTTYADCDHIAGTGKVKPGLTNVAQPVSAAVKSTFVGDCTGPLLATTGPLTLLKGKLVGSGSCDTTASEPSSPLAGKVSLVWTELNEKFKPLVSSTFVRVGTDPVTLDALNLTNGIVTKGPGVGYDVSGSLLYQPTEKKGLDNSTIDASGNIVPGAGSLALGLNCTLGTAALTTVVFGTDGTSLLGTPFDSSISLSLPD